VLLRDYEWVRKRAGDRNEHRLQRKKPKP
jgi:hypothetical protein